jgi:hypothetical protein
MSTSLKPQHHSVLRRRTIPKPRTLSSMDMEPDTRAFIEQEALEIFAEMTNSGATFQQSLAAVFLSGMNAGRSVLAGIDDALARQQAALANGRDVL